MVLDLLLAPLLFAIGAAVDLLPGGEPLDLPGLTAITDILEKINSLIPIGPVITVAVGLLSFLVLFIGFRIVLVVWNLIWP